MLGPEMSFFVPQDSVSPHDPTASNVLAKSTDRILRDRVFNFFMLLISGSAFIQPQVNVPGCHPAQASHAPAC
jgi:hypothetical protein